MVLILSGGLLLTVRLGILQVRKLGLALKWMVKNEEDGVGEISSFGALCVAAVLIGGIKRIVSIAQIVVPFMAVIYIILAVALICCNITRIPEAVQLIITGV